MDFSASFLFSSRFATVIVGGIVFGMSIIVVTPPFAAAIEPERKSSLCVIPGSLKWTWPSINPGITIFPFMSMTSSAVIISSEMYEILWSSSKMCRATSFPSSNILQFFSSLDFMLTYTHNIHL